MACECVKSALDDAGLQPSDVDGLVTFTLDSNPEMEVARNLGVASLSMFCRVPYGGGADAGVVMYAALAVASGVADVVVCYRAMNERSGTRFSEGLPEACRPCRPSSRGTRLSWHAPWGLLTPAAWVALRARRYMDAYGVTNEDFAPVEVVDPAHAARNPDAGFYGRPITSEDHQASRWVVEPVLRLLDCGQESGGGSCPRRNHVGKGAWTSAGARSGRRGGARRYLRRRDDDELLPDDPLGLPEMRMVASQLWEALGLGPADILHCVPL